MSILKFSVSVRITNHMNVDFCGNGVDILLKEFRLDPSYTRFALCVTLPLLFCVSLVRLSRD